MIAHCDCPAGMAPCGHPITQEDMLCDECRRGECRALGQPPTAEQRAAVAELQERAQKLLAELRARGDGITPRGSGPFSRSC